MTKYFTILMTFCLLFCFSCEPEGQDSSTSSTDDSPTTTTSTTEKESPEPAYDDPNSIATVYSDTEYGGKSQALNAGFHDESLTVGYDDISSIKIKKGYMVTLYDSAPNRGSQIVLKNSTADLATAHIHFDDKTSSLLIEEIPHKDFVYDHGLEHDNRCVDNGSEEYSVAKFTGSMSINTRLKEKESLISPNLKYALTVTNDGRLIVEEVLEHALCDDGRIIVFHAKEIWSNSTKGHDAAKNYYLTLQEDSNVCIYSGERDFVWASKTNGKDGNHLDLSNAGKLELFTVKHDNVLDMNAM